MKNEISGILAPLLVPYDDRKRINEQELRRLVRWLIDCGIHGLFPNGSTGEAVRLTSEERQSVVDIVCDETDGRVPVIAGLSEPNIQESLKVCQRYCEAGVRAVAVSPPVYYRLSQDSLYAFFSELAQNTQTELVLYNVPSFTTPLSTDTVIKLAEFRNIVGIKDSSGDIPSMMRMISSIQEFRPEFNFLTGWEAVLVPMLLIGCNGAVSASANVVPELLLRIFSLVHNGNGEEAVELQYKFLPLFDAMLTGFEFPDGFRAGAELRGFRLGPSRQSISITAAQNVENASRTKDLSLILSKLIDHLRTDLPGE